MNTYNGWTNYETWCVNLWATNEGGDWLADMARECLDESDNDRSDAVVAMATRLLDEHEDGMPDVSGVYVDLLRAALSEVNWREIAEHAVEDVYEEHDHA